MLIAKISPSASFSAEALSPFTAPSVKTADFIKVTARPYVAGCTRCNFEVEFLNATIVPATAAVPAVAAVAEIPATDTTPAVPAVPAVAAKDAVPEHATALSNIGRMQVQLDSNDLAAWGADDTTLLQIVAKKIGTSFVAAYTVQDNNPNFF